MNPMYTHSIQVLASSSNYSKPQLIPLQIPSKPPISHLKTIPSCLGHLHHGKQIFIIYQKCKKELQSWFKTPHKMQEYTCHLVAYVEQSCSKCTLALSPNSLSATLTTASELLPAPMQNAWIALNLHNVQVQEQHLPNNHQAIKRYNM